MRTSTEIFAENLRNLLIAKNKKQADLARFTGATSATVTYWCNGQAMPRAKMIDKICLFLGCSVEDLTTDHNKPVEYAPEDIIAEQIKDNPRLMRLLFYAMKLSDNDLDKLIEDLKR
jgi:transcriptional regulator with XRE-family HTH domain